MTQDNQRGARRLDGWRAEIRQRRYHRAFRIAEPRWDEAAPRFRGLANQLSAMLAQATDAAKQLTETPAGSDASETPVGVDASETPVGRDAAELVKAANNLWLVRKKYHRIADPASRDFRQINRYLDALEEALGEVGVTVQDHDGDEYDAGFLLEVMDFVPDRELRVETVQRTVRPSVCLHGQLIQKGQVIVGYPTDADRHDPMEDNDAGHH